MTKHLLLISLLGSAVIAVRAADEKTTLKDEHDRTSYAVGMNTGINMKKADLELDADLVAKGLKDGLSGGSTLMTEQEENEAFNKFRQQLMAKRQEQQKQMQEKQKQLAEKNKVEGPAFLDKNKTEPGVITLPSGLQYKITTEGSGDSPKSNDVVTVNYRGTFIDGTEFESSEKRGQPATFPVPGVISGWTEALQLMKPGAKWKLFIPANLAYKEEGRPPTIPGNSALEFDIELISIKHPEPTPPPPPAPQPLTSDIIKVPSAEELKHGAKIETIKPEDIEKEKEKERLKQTNN